MMDTSYTVIANAIHYETSLWENPVKLMYNGIHIDTSIKPVQLANLFDSCQYSLSDMKNILYIYVSLTGEKSFKVSKAIEFLKFEMDCYRYNRLKEKYNDLEDRYAKLEAQNMLLVKTCHDVCILAVSKEVNYHDKVIADVIAESKELKSASL